MIITTFEADGFRNLAGLTLHPHPVLNLITGDNGAGKSSLLEAIQCLASGVGFRSRRYRDHLAHDADAYTLRADLAGSDGRSVHRCGVRRGRDGSLDVRLDFESVGSFTDIARVMPVKVLTPDSHLLVQGSPDERRRFVDWGCFHAHETFLPVWRRYRRALSQRNELLREGAPDDEVRVWDEALGHDGERLHSLRAAYVADFTCHVKNRTQDVDFPFHVKLDLRSGWAKGDALVDVLHRNLDLHRRMRTTTDGPHRAELVIRADDHPARDVLSRGQQKLLVYLMHLAQLDALTAGGRVASAGTGAPSEGASNEGVSDGGEHAGPGTRPVVLCDDLSSELDDRAAGLLLRSLVASGSQVFVSGTTPPASLLAGGTDATPPLATGASDTTLVGPENPPDPFRSFAVFTLDAGRLRE